MNTNDTAPKMTKVSVTPRDLREIKSNANKHFFADAPQGEHEEGDFLVQCYAKGLEDFLRKRGIHLQLEFVFERSFQEPIE